VVGESKNLVAAIFLLPVWPLVPSGPSFFALFWSILSYFVPNGLPVARDGWASVGEARFVRATLLPVRTTSLRRVFRDSDHAEC